MYSLHTICTAWYTYLHLISRLDSFPDLWWELLVLELWFKQTTTRLKYVWAATFVLHAFACISLQLISLFPKIIMFVEFRCAFWTVSTGSEWLAAMTMLGLCHSTAKEIEGKIKRTSLRSKITHHLVVASHWKHKGRIKIMLWNYEGGLLSYCHVHCIGWDEFKNNVSDWWIGKDMVAL